MSAPAAHPWAWVMPKNGDKSVFVRRNSIETDAPISCREIDVVSRLRRAGFEHHP
jgi:hypothetical protein